MISHDSCNALGEEVEAPAMNYNGVVPSPSLHLVHLFNDISDGSKVGTHPIRCPVGDVKLGHLLHFSCLVSKAHVWFFTQLTKTHACKNIHNEIILSQHYLTISTSEQYYSFGT